VVAHDALEGGSAGAGGEGGRQDGGFGGADPGHLVVTRLGHAHEEGPPDRLQVEPQVGLLPVLAGAVQCAEDGGEAGRVGHDDLGRVGHRFPGELVCSDASDFTHSFRDCVGSRGTTPKTAWTRATGLDLTYRGCA
jgi:hypothetical protein